MRRSPKRPWVERSKSQEVKGDSVDAPGFVRWDAFAAYHMNLGETRPTAQVNVNNILGC
ncbi:MAG: hypothetical protein ACREX4_25500 [Gammaproteobacteria bacterium]